MAVPDGAILRAVSSMLLPQSVIAQNVFNAVFADTGISNSDADVITDLIFWINSLCFGSVVADIDSAANPTEIAVYIYDPLDDDWDEVGSDAWTVVFTGAGDMFPHGVAPIVRAKTMDPDVQGRKFLPGFVETTAADGALTAPALADLANFGTGWITPFVGAATGGDFVPVVWSVAQKVAKIMNGVYILNGQMGYQRRRKPGVGI